MKLLTTLVALPLLGVLGGCSAGLSVHQDYDPSADFAAYQTYAWSTQQQSPTGDPRLDNDLTVQRIRGAVDAELAARGFRQVDADAAGFLIAYYATIGQKVDVYPTTTTLGYGWGPYYHGGYYGTTMTTTDVYEYEEGTLILDFIDGKTKNLVWRGTGKKALASTPAPPEEQERRLRAVASQILAQFPPNVKKK